MTRPVVAAGPVAHTRGMRVLAVIGLLAGLGLAACTHQGGVNTNPVVRKFTWFSYVNGDGIRAGCVAGAPPRFRFVYNGVYQRHVRSYDIVPDAFAPGVFRLTSRVIGPTDISRIVLTEPGDIFAPARGTIVASLLSRDDIAALEAALVDSGFFGVRPVGADLRDLDFFWTGVACIDGEVTFNAFRWPSERFQRASFPAVLLGWDETGVPIAEPRVVTRLEAYGGEGERDRLSSPTFLMTIAENGLVGQRR